MHSALYHGWVSHRRGTPARHAFRYRLFMVWLDLAELPQVFAGRWLWSVRRIAPARFRREDYLGPTDRPLDVAVRDLVAERTGRRPLGPVRMLTNLRYFGYCFNPVTFYYCYDAAEHLEAIIADVTNTPWGEHHQYVLPLAGADTDGGALRWRHHKEFHVSPFMPMDMDYEWRFGARGDGLQVQIVSRQAGEQVFDATLALRRRPMTGVNLAVALARFPFLTAKVVLMIHWQAVRLWLKRVPFHAHPGNA